MPLLFNLYWEFFKVGLFAIGGGMATFPFLAKLAVKSGWYTQQELINMIAISESTPGPIGVNMSTYVGFHTAGVAGALISTLGLVTPSIIVILIVAQFLKKFGESKYVKAVMYGLRAASAGLIAAAGLTVAWMVLLNQEALHAQDFSHALNFKALCVAVIIFFLTKKYKKVHPIVFLGLAAAVGVLGHFAV